MKKTLLARLSRCMQLCLVVAAFAVSCTPDQEPAKLLLYTKAANHNSGSSQSGINIIRQLASEQGINVTITDDAAAFTDARLQEYSTLVFLNTEGNVLTKEQQLVLENYVKAGGGFMALHASSAEQQESNWYKNLFSSEQEPQQLLTATHPAANEIFEVIPYGRGVAYLLKPIKTDVDFNDRDFQEQLSEAIGAAVAAAKEQRQGNPAAGVSEHMFSRTVLSNKLKEPMELQIAKNGQLLCIEKGGGIYALDTSAEDKTAQGLQKIGSLTVNTEHGHGLLGLALDPDFVQNQFLYLYYTPASTKPTAMHVSRFMLVDGKLSRTSEKIILKIPIEFNESGHLGGSLAFDNKGYLYISTGDHTYALQSDGYSPLDERPGQQNNDAQRTAANTNDLRGKILRIKPEPDGTYTIPEDNLFPADGSQGLPEIYVMGCRNPFRIAVDERTNYLYWGEVGPDAGVDSTRGARGYDEINQVRKAGNFGWPYFIANNLPYASFDFATQKTGPLFQAASPVNNSVNNSGSKQLPPAVPAFISYPYAPSIFGEGARCAIAGPVYHYNPELKTNGRFPEYFDNRLFIGDWSRNWVMTVQLDKNGNYVRTEPFMPSTKLNHPIDMAFGPDGAFYMLEYGDPWGFFQEGGMLSRVEYNAGSRPPVAVASANETVGGVPFTVQFSSEGSFNFDRTNSYKTEWKLNGKPFGNGRQHPSYTFHEPGEYEAVLTVTDKQGAQAKSAVRIKVGNAKPEVKLITAANQSFYWDREPLTYYVKVQDKEDKLIDPDRLQVRLDYLPQGNDVASLLLGDQTEQALPADSKGHRIIEKTDCYTCHAMDRQSYGPAFTAVAGKYEQNEKTITRLASKVIQGGGGVWGSHAMNAHPQLSKEDAATVVRYILSLNTKASSEQDLPASGTVVLDAHLGKGNEGKYVLSATYLDKGGPKAEAQKSSSQLLLRHPRIDASGFSRYSGITRSYTDGHKALVHLRHGSYLVLKDIDLRDVKHIGMKIAAAGGRGTVEVRKGRADGPVLGKMRFKPMGSWQSWQEMKLQVKDPGGKHDLYFVFISDASNQQKLAQLSWIEFYGKASVAQVVNRLNESAVQDSFQSINEG